MFAAAVPVLLFVAKTADYFETFLISRIHDQRDFCELVEGESIRSVYDVKFNRFRITSKHFARVISQTCSTKRRATRLVETIVFAVRKNETQCLLIYIEYKFTPRRLTSKEGWERERENECESSSFWLVRDGRVCVEQTRKAFEKFDYPVTGEITPAARNAFRQKFPIKQRETDIIPPLWLGFSDKGGRKVEAIRRGLEEECLRKRYESCVFYPVAVASILSSIIWKLRRILSISSSGKKGFFIDR
jgi:hypothetical protein